MRESYADLSDKRVDEQSTLADALAEARERYPELADRVVERELTLEGRVPNQMRATVKNRAARCSVAGRLAEWQPPSWSCFSH